VLNVLLDLSVVLGLIGIVGGKFCSTMESIADGSDSLAKGSIVLRRSPLVLYFKLILEFLYGTMGRWYV
jgi:hypothetical protein